MLKLIFLVIAITTTISAQLCTTSTCTLNCINIDYNIQRCTYDYAPYDNLLSCICRDIVGLKANTGTLNSCVACNKDGLGSSSLAYYQILTAGCDLYYDEGEAAAVSLIASSSAAVVSFFSSSYFPIIEAAQCSASATSIASGSPSAVKTSGSPSPVTSSTSSSVASPASVTALPTGITASSQISSFPSTIGTAFSSIGPASDSSGFTSVSGSALSLRSGGGKTAPGDSTTQQTTNAVQQPTATTSTRSGLAAAPGQEPMALSLLIAVFALLGFA